MTEQTMPVIILETHGGPEVLESSEQPAPRPRPGEVVGMGSLERCAGARD